VSDKMADGKKPNRPKKILEIIRDIIAVIFLVIAIITAIKEISCSQKVSILGQTIEFRFMKYKKTVHFNLGREAGGRERQR